VSDRTAGVDAVRESFTLPLMLLSVAAAGGFRMPASGAGMQFLHPPVMALVLAVLLMGVMVRAGLLVPGLLVSDARSGLENASGAAVLAALFLASAQVIQCLAPESGLLHLIYYTFMTVLMWNTLAAAPDRMRLLHSLFVIFGSAFLLKYVALASLYDPEGGVMRRVVTALLEGVALGTLQYAPFAPVTGYVAFFTALVYLATLTLLPRARRALVPLRTDQGLVTDAEPVTLLETRERSDVS
jgi:hypothetical protein